jgi:hypothetical protein
MRLITIGMIAAAAFLTTAATASAQRGPVASACAEDIQTYCKGLPHMNRAVRNCLEANKAKVADSCRQTLDTTGPGRGGCGYGQGCGRRNSAN